MALPNKRVLDRKTTNKKQLNDIKTKTKEFLLDRKHSNNLVDLISLCEVEEADIAIGCVKAFHKIFSSLIASQAMYLEKPVDENRKGVPNDVKYKLWLREMFSDVKHRLLQLLAWEHENVQEITLSTLMKFISLEGQSPIQKVGVKHLSFPALSFQDIVQALLSPSHNMLGLIERFQEYIEYDDVRYYLLKFCLESITSEASQEPGPIYFNNMLAMLQQITIPNRSEDDTLQNFMSKLPGDGQKLKINTPREHKKLFSTVWIKFLSNKLSSSIYKKVLVCLHDKLMPNMTNPLLLSDFLTESYNIGGSISLLALNGLFILVNKYNLDYPDFYQKLYALFEPSVFHVKYRARFFYLSDLFLSSPLLPAYLVAAFVKRLARLGLSAPPTGLAVIIPFIYNLLIRHPNCKVLLDRQAGGEDLADDPYILDEKDPAKCNAMKSSLWELKTLQSHYYHSVSTSAKQINEGLPRREIDISQHLEVTSDELFQKECKKRMKEDPAVTFEPPKGLFGARNDQMKEFWTLD